ACPCENPPKPVHNPGVRCAARAARPPFPRSDEASGPPSALTSRSLRPSESALCDETENPFATPTKKWARAHFTSVRYHCGQPVGKARPSPRAPVRICSLCTHASDRPSGCIFTFHFSLFTGCRGHPCPRATTERGLNIRCRGHPCC